ncbi:hypothetical protein IFM89_017930 [Coptis chinensis]|uniref:Uncharacterized protein n=1 Tax=Coptis chinensis TaxID=261450 RepID=A0A835LUN2_9MAGN|nr:hypothetical protein IFM89_017930 [Coptis chinensis]
MEAAITSDDVVRTGGFGAIDDIGSFFLWQAIQQTVRLLFVRLEMMRNHKEKQTNRVGKTWTSLLHLEFLQPLLL